MCENRAGPESPTYVRVYAIDGELGSSSILASNVPLAVEAVPAGVASWYPVSGSAFTIVLLPPAPPAPANTTTASTASARLATRLDPRTRPSERLRMPAPLSLDRLGSDPTTWFCA